MGASNGYYVVVGLRNAAYQRLVRTWFSMIVSTASLAAAGVASRNKSEPWFNRLHVTPSGEAVASNGRAILVVEPVDPSPSRAGAFPPVEPQEAEPPPSGVGIPLDVVDRALRSVTKENKPSLKYAQVTQCSPVKVELMTTDGSRTAKASAPPMRRDFPEWRPTVARAMSSSAAEPRHVLVDRQSLIELLKAIDRSCPDKINRNPVFVEIGASDEPIVLRAFNGSTNQHVVGVLKPLSAGGKWLRRSPWEAELAGEVSEGRVRRVRRDPEKPESEILSKD